MKVKIRSFAGFRHILGKENEVDLAEGASIEDLLDALCAAHGELKPQVFGESGIRDDVNVIVDGKNIAALQGMQTKLAEGDVVALFPAAIGG
jgi:molybdopterin synthase sulfur carrier subunit